VSAVPALSVVVATYNRAAAVERLLGQLTTQSLPASAFEVIIVDDGSAQPVEPQLRRLALPFALHVVTQLNGGPAVARHQGALHARGEVLLIVDDDMLVGADFLEAHLAAHPAESRNVVLGSIRPAPGAAGPLFERYQASLLERQAAELRAGRTTLVGSNLYTGNVSVRRADYLGVGGFDPAFRLSEDAELGIRLELAGCTFVFSEAAVSFHASDHASLAGWMRRSLAYGAADSRVAEKHPDVAAADPWRFLFMVNALSRPLLLASALFPAGGRALAHVAMALARALAAVRVERAALAGATLVYGLLYYAGLGGYAGSRRRTLEGLGRHLRRRRDDELGPVSLLMKLVVDVRADHAAVCAADAKYGAVARRGSLLGDLVQRIGFQMMVGYRVMRWLRGARLGILARITSRVMRHLYAADLHWDAELAPGVIIVHGNGLVVSHAARVGPGCVLFHGVTLGMSIDPESEAVGAPVLEHDVHVGPGATLLGPITVGARSKVMAGTVLMDSVPPYSIVEHAAATIRARGPRRVRRPADADATSEVA
jgi:serine acetyltransferase/GT2 family glycosyltransferase